MNDYKTITKLFENEQDEIGFRLFKESNIIKLNNKNNNNYDNNQIEFNTQSLSSKLINYSNAYIEVEIELEIPFDETDQGKKSIPKLIALKNSYEIVKNLKIQLNNVIISNESNIHRSNLVNFILNNSYNSPSSYRNIRKSNQDSLNITNNKFISKETYFTKRENEDETKPHYITFKIPIFLKDISDYFRKIDFIQFGEFNINIQLIDNIFVVSREGCTYEIKNVYLYTEEVKLTDSDNIKYLKMLDNKFTKKINFMENHTLTFNEKLKEINEDFAINNIRNSDSVFIYGILNTKKEGLNNDLPSVKFENPYLNIDNIRFENPIPNDISAYNIIKNKSNHSDNFIITYKEFLENYRIYCFNVNRQTQNDTNNKFMNIITNIENTSSTVYIVWRNYSVIEMEYNKNGLNIYKTY